MKHKNLATLTDMQLARHFVDTNESTMTAPRDKYLELSREANRVREYGLKMYGAEQWEHLTNRIYANR